MFGVRNNNRRRPNAQVTKYQVDNNNDHDAVMITTMTLTMITTMMLTMITKMMITILSDDS